MANTERLNALQYVIDARRAIDDVRGQDGLTQKQQKMLDDVHDSLVDMEDLLVEEDIQKTIKGLEQGESDLKELIKRMKQSSKDIQQLTNAVADAAKAVGAVADIIATAASAGIL